MSRGRGVVERASAVLTTVAVIRSVWIPHRDMSAPATRALSWDQIIHVTVSFAIVLSLVATPLEASSST